MLVEVKEESAEGIIYFLDKHNRLTINKRFTMQEILLLGNVKTVFE